MRTAARPTPAASSRGLRTHSCRKLQVRGASMSIHVLPRRRSTVPKVQWHHVALVAHPVRGTSRPARYSGATPSGDQIPDGHDVATLTLLPLPSLTPAVPPTPSLSPPASIPHPERPRPARCRGRSWRSQHACCNHAASNFLVLKF
jgi:hypothetical protein